MTVDERFRSLAPLEIVLPCEHSPAVISVPLAVESDPVQVVAPCLNEVKGALAVGSAELIRQYCALWTRFLAQAGSRVRRVGS